MDRHGSGISSSGRRRNVVKPGRIDAILGQDRGGLRLNFGLAMHQQRSFTVAKGRARPSGGGGGAGHQGGIRRDIPTSGDSSEPFTHSGSLSQSQGAYSHGLFPSQGVSLSQGTISQMGHQSQSEAACFGVSQPSPDMLAPYTPNQHGVGGEPSVLRSISKADGARTGGRETEPAERFRGARTTSHHGNPEFRLSSSSASSKTRRPQPLQRDEERRRGHPSSRSSASGKGIGFVNGGIETTATSRVTKGVVPEAAAFQAFERLLSEQFRTQVMSELSGLRTLVESTRDSVAEQTENNSKVSTATQELQQELRETRIVVQKTNDASAKAVQLFETNVPPGIQSLETRLCRAEDSLAAISESVKTMIDSNKEAVVAANAATSAVSAAAASMNEMIALRKRQSYNIDGERAATTLQPLLRSQQHSDALQYQHHHQYPPELAPASGNKLSPPARDHSHDQQSSRKRKGGRQQQDYPHNSSAALQDEVGDGRKGDDRAELEAVGTTEWRGADESLRWTQPWGGPGTATGASVVAGPTSRSDGRPPHLQSTVHPNEPVPKVRGLHSSVGGSSPVVGRKSSSSSLSRFEKKEVHEISSCADGIDHSSPSPPSPPAARELDSYNPFHEQDMVSIAAISSEMTTEGAIKHRGFSSPIRRKLPTRRGPMARSPAAVRRRSTGLGSTALGKQSKKKREEARSRSPLTAAAPKVFPVSGGENRTTSAGGSSMAMISHSPRTMPERARKGEGGSTSGKGRIEGLQAGSVTRSSSTRSPRMERVMSSKISRRSQQRPSANMAWSGASWKLELPRQERSKPMTHTNQQHRAHGASPSLPDNEDPSEVEKGGAGMRSHGASAVCSELIPEGARYHRRSELERGPGGTGAAETMGTPVLGGRTEAAARPSALSASDEEQDDEEEGGFGDSGLTVEAYMHKKRQSKRSRNGSTSVSELNARRKTASRAKVGTSAAPSPERISACTNTRGVASQTRAAVRRSRSVPRSSSSPRDTQTGGKRARAGTGKGGGRTDSWLVGGGSGWLC